jgi:hypothetical protein
LHPPGGARCAMCKRTQPAFCRFPQCQHTLCVSCFRKWNWYAKRCYACDKIHIQPCSNLGRRLKK